MFVRLLTVVFCSATLALGGCSNSSGGGGGAKSKPVVTEAEFTQDTIGVVNAEMKLTTAGYSFSDPDDISKMELTKSEWAASTNSEKIDALQKYVDTINHYLDKYSNGATIKKDDGSTEEITMKPEARQRYGRKVELVQEELSRLKSQPQAAPKPAPVLNFYPQHTKDEFDQAVQKIDNDVQGLASSGIKFDVQTTVDPTNKTVVKYTVNEDALHAALDPLTDPKDLQSERDMLSLLIDLTKMDIQSFQARFENFPWTLINGGQAKTMSRDSAEIASSLDKIDAQASAMIDAKIKVQFMEPKKKAPSPQPASPKRPAAKKPVTKKAQPPAPAPANN